MSDKQESFWVIPKIELGDTPYGILKSAAAQLTRATGGLLSGTVYSLKSTARLYSRGSQALDLDIRAESLDNYSIELLRYVQPVIMYPGALQFRLSSEEYEIKDSHDLRARLKTILSSEPVQKIVGSLLAQAASRNEEG